MTQLLSDTAVGRRSRCGDRTDRSVAERFGGTDGVEQRIASTVSALLGGGELGDVVGAQVASTVVGLLTNPVVGSALADLFDTVLTDSSVSSGVVTAFFVGGETISLWL